MIKYATVKREATVIESFVCNKCGKELKKFEDSGVENIPDGEHVGFITAGIPETSAFFKVGETFKEFSFSMCDECVYKMFESFEIEPTCQDVDCNCDGCECCDDEKEEGDNDSCGDCKECHYGSKKVTN